jgi:hypothetical protein
MTDCPILCAGGVQEEDQGILNLIPSDLSGHEISLEHTSAVFEFRLEKVRGELAPPCPVFAHLLFSRAAA